MITTDMQETVEYRFDCFVRKVLIRAAMNIHNECSRRRKHEFTFSDLSEAELTELITFDTYGLDSYTFNVQGMDVIVADSAIAAAIETLSEKKRNIVLLFYFVGMSDAEIATVLNLVRSTIYRHRTNALLTLKKYLEENKQENE